MGHLGLTPQSEHTLGGYRVQGREDEDARQMRSDAKALEAAGCFSLVLELIPAALARDVTEFLTIPTIGIGSGIDCSGQILVLQDMLGFNDQFQPRFLRTYLEGGSLVRAGLEQYVDDVRQSRYPAPQESFS